MSSFCALGLVVLLAASPSASGADRAFIEQALASGHTEIAQAAAQAHSPDANVRAYAASITTDHKAIDGRLEKIASSLGVTTSSVKVTGRTASQAPAAYLRSQIDEHEKAIALYQHEAAAGSSERLRALAKEIVPILQSHVTLAKNLLAQLEGKTAPVGVPSARPTLRPNSRR